MKVVILIESMSRRGGTEIVARNLAVGLEEAGVKLKILPLDEYPEGVTERRRYVERFCKSHGIDTVLNFTYENLELLPFRVTNIRTIGVYHWSVRGYERSLRELAGTRPWPLNIASKVKLSIQFHRLHRLIQKCNVSVALTNRGKEELKQLAPKAEVQVIPNFLPYDRQAEKRSKAGNRKAVFVGRLSREKGVYHLLDIWERVAKVLPDVTLEIFGEGHEREGLEKEVQNRKIPRIVFKGFETNAEKIYKDADLLLCTSETEGFGMVLIEAMHFGVVPVAFDCPVSPKEIMANAGVAVECFDTDRYAAEVVNLFEDSTRQDVLREKGRKRAAEFYKPVVIKQWLTLLDQFT